MYDLIIIGAGSAGLPAGMYASRYKLKNIIIGEMPGGALSTSHCVENFPGVLSAPGAEIMDNFKKHAENAGSEILQDRVEVVSKIGENHFSVSTMSGKNFDAKRILLATGNTYKMLGIPGEKEFYGQGVSYCATCDGNFYKNLTVGVVGAGNTAITEALYLAEIAKEVHIFVRGDVIRAENIWTEKANNTSNIIFHMNTQVTEVQGNMMGVTGVILNTGENLTLDGLFVAIGSTPITHIVDNLSPQKDGEGCLVVDQRQETTIPGLYAAGDVTTNSNKFRQTIMSAAEGCLAANSIHEDILKITQ
ncbi:MAG: FAD-dependent oxidoreductase [Candidatus Gracilibacteria bacterium]|nr:FAD-dependent oxidoreductase [Candidatus Gracilibacteria bacterium]